jgi:anaerobic C4-dicarboxylate transporter
LENRSVGKNGVQMDIAAVVIVVLSVVFTAAVVIGLFIWAAVKDGEEDKAVQKRLGIRRKTRLGR